MESIASLGSNEFVMAKFRAEEKRLLNARQQLAASVAPAQAAPVRVVSTAQVIKVMDRLAQVLVKKPAAAKEALASIIESIVLTPGPEGYTAKLTVRNGTGRAPEGGGLFVQSGCGGRI